MVIEATHCQGLEIGDKKGNVLGLIDFLVINGKDARISGAQIKSGGVISSFRGLNWLDLTGIDRRGLTVASEKELTTNLRDLDELFRQYGKVLGISAKTESGRNLGHVTDLLFDAETGMIIRFVLRGLLQERIIPRQFLVSITPKQIIFQDVVDQPIFDKLASSPQIA